ncbi:MAG: efflux RND transporter periplasmic adaptor subunit [Candidatus Competibacteraceae bacterium]|nr:efflux RND transporter periplasmic adaptor subunit [Candidatus Competibacteraceae bacterium]
MITTTQSFVYFSASILLLLQLAGCGGENKDTVKERPPRLVAAIKVADTDSLSKRDFPGRAKAGQEVNLSFRVSGPLISLPINIGDSVQQGDIIARIDPKDFETAVSTVQAQFEREQARAKRAQQDLQRLENIRREDPGATSEAAIDRAQQTRDSASASARSLEATVTTAQDRLSYTQLQAPFDGIVVDTYVENFETVVAKQAIVRLLNPSNIEFIISVPESLISLAPYVDNIEVRFDALPDVVLNAQIKEIGKEASQATRTYPVTLAMTPPQGVEILPGMAGHASVTSKLPEASELVGIDIPATAVFTGIDASKSYVWVVDEASNTLSRREVEQGRLSAFGVLIKSGLQPGEWIVIKGVHSVAEGEQVRLQNDTHETTGS